MFYTRLKEVCKSNGTTVTSVLKELKISTSAVGNWNKGSLPTGDTLVALSTHLNVSIDYLLLGKSAVASNSFLDMVDITPDEYNILNTYREMDMVGKKLLQDQLKFIWADHRQPDSKVPLTNRGNCG